MATKLQSHFRRVLMKKQVELQIESKLKEYLSEEKMKIEDKLFHMRLVKHEDGKMFINARNIQKVTEFYSIEVQSEILKNYLN
jgi:hypothetical protein